MTVEDDNNAQPLLDDIERPIGEGIDPEARRRRPSLDREDVAAIIVRSILVNRLLPGPRWSTHHAASLPCMNTCYLFPALPPLAICVTFRSNEAGSGRRVAPDLCRNL